MSEPAAERAVTIDEVRAQLGAWVAASWDTELRLRDWRERLAASGWAAPSWPTQWHGRGLPAWADDLVGGELLRLGAVGVPLGGGTSLAGPTIVTHGPDALRSRFLHPILTGAETWCQLFSEPGAGSDLAGLSASAELDGDEWVVNGQKVWNTSAHHADLGMLLVRTDRSAPKHRGISYLVLPMRQPGVEIRPLRQMNFHQSFNEVFLTDARVPRDWVVGGVGEGWPAALTTLAYERRFGAMSRPRFVEQAGRALDEARAEADDHFATYRWYPQRAGRPDLLIDRAARAGCWSDPVVRDAVIRTLSLQRASGWTAGRASAARALGRAPGAEGSVGKLATSEVARRASAAHSTIVGAAGMLAVPDAPDDGIVAEVLISVPAQSIAGGTDEIQKNILGERMLGLPREPPST